MLWYIILQSSKEFIYGSSTQNSSVLWIFKNQTKIQNLMLIFSMCKLKYLFLKRIMFTYYFLFTLKYVHCQIIPVFIHGIKGKANFTCEAKIICFLRKAQSNWNCLLSFISSLQLINFIQQLSKLNERSLHKSSLDPLECTPFVTWF